MNTNIVLKFVFCLSFAVSASSVEYRPEGGPVYVNPVNQGSSEKVSALAAAKSGFLTQTVYGFLDFTTTIGNTVMVFSPQSSAFEGKKEVRVEPIVSKPETTEESQPEISPSRPIENSSTEEEDNSSVSPETSVEPSEPETGEFVSSMVSVIEPQDDVEDDENEENEEQDSIFSSPGDSYDNEPIIESSQVEPDESEPSDSFSSELVENTPSLEKVSSVVSVQSKVVESSPQIAMSSKVNVVEGSSSVKVVVAPVSSSIKVVEAPASSVSEEVPAVPAISVNNIENKPEYDFLSRQPTEIVDETFEVIDLKPSAIKYPNKVRSVSNDLKSRAIGNAGKGGVGDGYQPVGVISSMGGTVVREGVTTVHQTNVIGTFVSGKYAQVLQSTSHVYQPDAVPEKKKNIKPSATARILKTSAPNLGKQQKVTPLEASPVGTLDEDNSALPLEALFSSSPGVNLIRQSRRPAIGNTPTFKNRFSGSRNRNRDELENKNDYGSFENNDSDAYLESDYIAPSPSAVPAYRQKTKNRGNANANANAPQNSRQTFKYNNGRQRTQTPELATVSVFNEQASAAPSGGRKYQSPSRRPNYKKDTGSSNNLIDSNANHSGRRGYKPKVATSGVEQPYNHQTTSLYKFKLTRPTGRWQYKTSPKPRVTIRRQDEHLDNTTYTTPQNPDLIHNPVHIDPDQDISGSGSAYYNNQQDNENVVQPEPSVTAETIKVEISTPADFRNVYYEIATIKSPYSFQVGTVKNTRFITVTSTIEKSLVEPTQAPEQPLVENILATTQNAYDKEPPLDSSIATLPPIGLAGEAETPPLETMTETFSTTQLLLKTHILPVIRGGANNTTSYTLVQSYHVTRLVTAIKTLPPMEVYQFVPSKTLNEFNTKLDEAGSELNLDIEFGDQNEDQPEMTNEQRILLNSDDIDSIGSDFDVTDLDKNIKNLSNINSGEQHLRLKKAHKFTSPQQNSIPTTSQEPPTSTPGLTPEQIQQLALLKYLNPAAAANLPNAITTSKPIIRIETVYESHVIPLINGANTLFTTISRPVATVSKTEYEMVTSSIGFPQPPVAPLFPPLNPFAPAVTTTPIVTQTMVTQTQSKVLKLTFGAKTAFTTLYSTKVVPTMLTTYLTASVPTQATAAPFNPFFQQPYAPFPYLG